MRSWGRKIYFGILFGAIVLPVQATDCGGLFSRSLFKAQPEIHNLLQEFDKFPGLESHEKSRPVKLMMAAIEVGQVPGLKNSAGGALNISAGGVGTVMTDLTHEYPKFLKQMNGGELSVVGLLMDGIDRTGLKHLYNVKTKIDGADWDIGVFEHVSPSGTRYLFIDNPSFQRLTVLR